MARSVDTDPPRDPVPDCSGAIGPRGAQAPASAQPSSPPGHLPLPSPASWPRLDLPADGDGDGDGARPAHWHSARGDAPPAQARWIDDRTPANTAFRWAEEGQALLWRGDFGNARHLLQALARRADRPPRPGSAAARRLDGEGDGPARPGAAFLRERRRQAWRATLLSRLVIVTEADHRIALPRAPDWRAACAQVWGAPVPGDASPHAAPLTELLGIASAAEWRRTGVEVPELGPPPRNRIHPHHGVFSPVRGEYLSLVATLPLPRAGAGGGSGDPARLTAFDIGTGTGVLAALLARRGAGRVVATDVEPRAVACARENLARLGLDDRVAVEQRDGFPEGRADLVVCNPPWLPAEAVTPLERAVYDPGGAMLSGFLAALPAHLNPGGEGWLVLSDLAERLGLREPGALVRAFEAAGLAVLGRRDTRPRHPRSRDADDPLHAARAGEVTTLWRLGVARRG